MLQLIAGAILILVFVAGFVGYISNIIFIFKLESFTATGETILATGETILATGETILATIGVFLPPIGIIHGIYTWF